MYKFSDASECYRIANKINYHIIFVGDIIYVYEKNGTLFKPVEHSKAKFECINKCLLYLKIKEKEFESGL